MATDSQTSSTRDEKTDGSGRYSFANLNPGTYSIKVTANGFRTVEQNDFVITPNVIGRIDVHLQVGQATETVTVTADAVQLQTDKADTHTELTSKAIVDMPLGGFRNYQALIDLVPGASPSTFQNSITDTPGRALRTNINGGNAQTNITQIDGAESINVWLPHHVGYVVPAEDVDVVNVTTSASDADQGLAGVSAITVVTKSGTNQIHGSAFEFNTNQHFDARNFFATTKPVSIYNNYGGTFGGAIKKNKLFYFGSFDGTNQKIASNGFFTVPTADQMSGNFSSYLSGPNATIIYNPLTGNADGSGRQPFANNVVPSNLISPIAMKVQSYFPTANIPGAIANNYYAAGGPILNRYQADGKLDWNRTEKHHIFVKYGRMWATSGGQGIFGVAGGPAPGADPGLGDTVTQVATIGTTYTFTPNLVFTGSFGLNRLDQIVKGNDYGKEFGQILGIPGLNGPDIRDSGFPNISIGGYTEFGVPNWMPLFRNDETFTQNDSLTWTKGAHQFSFGFDLVRHHLNHWQPELSFGGPRGYLDFSGQTTALNTAGNASVTNQFNAYAQFLLGLSDDVQKGVQYILMTGREWQFGWYGQDRWQVTRNLTVTLGLRYELYPLMTRSNGKGIERYDPTTNLVYMGGRGSVPENAGISVSHTLFAPHAGIAYRMGDKMVVRAGYGLNYDPIPYSRPLRGFYPLTINAETKSPNSFSYASTLASGIPPVPLPDISTGIVPLPTDASERSPWGYIHRGYVQSWNVTVERKLPEDIVASIGYVGSHSVHLLADRDINTGYPGSTLANLPYNLLYGRTQPSSMWDGYLSSSYNSLQIAFSRAFSRGLMLKGAYTWSHAIDYSDDDGWTGVNFNYAPMFQRNRATAGFDVPQNFQIGWVYELPFGKGKSHINSGPAALIVGGWQLSGREAMYVGTPFTVGAPDTSLNDGGTNTQTANQVLPNVQFLGHVGPGAYYYNPAAFAPVTTQSFGNSGLNILREPGMWNTDLSIVRDFKLKERFTLQFRTEFTNLPNTSHFNASSTGSGFGNGGGGVDNYVTDSSFMQVTSSSGERMIRFGLRLHW